MLTDILALFAENPLRPPIASAARAAARLQAAALDPLRRGIVPDRACTAQDSPFDNEASTPRRADPSLPPGRPPCHQCASGSNSCATAAMGRAMLWLADGWAGRRKKAGARRSTGSRCDGDWLHDDACTACAARSGGPRRACELLRGRRLRAMGGNALPTEFEWEIAARGASPIANDLSSGALRPLPAPSGSVDAPRQMFGDVWQWTQSAYSPTRAIPPPKGAIGEYNGKFMVSQQVLRGASFVTPRGHAARPIAISFIRTSAGNSWACDWRRTDDAAAIDASRGAARCAKAISRNASSTDCRSRTRVCPADFCTTPAAARFSRTSRVLLNIIRPAWRSRCSKRMPKTCCGVSAKGARS